MGRRRIAIIGGGLAGLSAAFELSRTASLRARYEVTVYQMGWRLGGKCASGRDRAGRIIEHGLHVWFGFYENAFGMLREVYADFDAPSASPIRDMATAFAPHRLTLFGDEINGDHTYWPVRWPARAGEPGDGKALPSVWEAAVRMIELAGNIVRDWRARRSGDPSAGAARSPGTANAFAEVLVLASNVGRLLADLATRTGMLGLLRRQLESVRRAASSKPDDLETKVLEQLLDILLAFVKGVLTDFLINRLTIDDLDELDFREWLVLHGANEQLVARSDLIKSLYNTMFQYEEGDLRRPNYAAGTAIQVLVRIIATQKGAVFSLLQTGMGEAVIAPLYTVLTKRGVRFEFFSKAIGLKLDARLQGIAAVDIERQAVPHSGPYRPLVSLGGLLCWPEEPLWPQLANGDLLQRNGAAFESHWNPSPPVRIDRLKRGIHFDDVVLAVPLGAFKKLNGDAGLCDELLVSNFELRAMVQSASLVPTLALQWWSHASSAELSGTPERAALVAGVEPFDIWADMSPLLALEPSTSGRRVRSLHYLCGVLGTALHTLPQSRFDVPRRAHTLAETAAARWLDRGARVIWPGLRGSPRSAKQLAGPQPARNGLDGDVYIRANVSPTDCCVASPKGSTKWRLATDELPFENLYLAGSWIKTGLNTDCVESAVMSGRQAARAVSGEPITIVGEYFMRDDPRGHGLMSSLARPIAALVGGRWA